MRILSIQAKSLLAVALSVLVAYMGGSTAAQEPSGALPDGYVVMISIDGLVPEYYTAPAQIGLKVPNLVEMKLGGAYADGVEGVYPSVTYPSHTTLVTGTRPATHGIIQNRIFEAPTDEQTREWYWFARDLKSETLWMIARNAGLVTGAVGWPVTVGAEIDYNMPEIFDPKETPPTPKRTLQYTTPGLIADALGGLSRESTTDGRRVAVSEFIIKKYRPRLMLIHLVELDSAHHRYGTGSPEAIKTAELEDGYIGRIVEASRQAGTFDRTTFFIVSDHGFAEVTRRFAPNVVLVREKLITLGPDGKAIDWKAAAWPAGGSCAIILRDPNDRETAARVASIFGAIAARSDGPISRIIEPGELKQLGAVPPAALMLDAAPGFVFGEALSGPETTNARDYRGTHGQLPSRADMRASLIIYGAGARAGARLPLARMIDIAPTAAAVLGLRLQKAEGIPIEELLKPGVIRLPGAEGKNSKRN